MNLLEKLERRIELAKDIREIVPLEESVDDLKEAIKELKKEGITICHTCGCNWDGIIDYCEECKKELTWKNADMVVHWEEIKEILGDVE